MLFFCTFKIELINMISKSLIILAILQVGWINCESSTLNVLMPNIAPTFVILF
jgi:hypothetical protein